MKPSIPAGTRDFLPQVMMRREHIFATIKQVFRKYGYAPIETPALEQLSVLTGKYGEEGDRLMFKVLNNGDFLKGVTDLDDPQKLSFQICDRALRYDLTVPFARFVVMNQNELTFPFKRFQIQPVWRADRPQKGRYREFYQCDADVVGSDSLLFEAEFVAMFDEALSTLGIPGFTVLLNNRKILQGYAEVVNQQDRFAEICIAIDKLDKKPAAEVKEEMIGRGLPGEAIDKVLEIISYQGSNEEKLDFLENAFATSDIGRKGVEEMREVLSIHKHFPRFHGEIKLDLQLARGLDYYTGTIFEVKAKGVSIGSICGGGRYANLTGVFGKPGLSGVGISFGADRIYDVMSELGLFQDKRTTSTEVLLIHFPGEGYATSLRVLAQLRAAGIPAELYPEPAKLAKQFTYADKLGIPFTLVIGDEEVKNNQFKLKDMLSGEQSQVSLEELLARWGK